MSERVLVTGAGGFIGSHLVEALVTNGYDVRAFVHYSSSGSWGWLEDSSVKDDIEVFPGDIRDSDGVNKAVLGVSTVFHLAALVGIPYSYRSPEAYLRTNIEGTFNVLQAAVANGAARVIQTSTSEVYGSAQYVPIDEDHPVHPQSPYAASKVSGDALALSFHTSFGLPVSIVRPFNTYGPRQSPRAVIPTIVMQALSGHGNVKLGDTTPTRDFNFVLDTVRGFVHVAESDTCIGETVNLATGREVSIADLVGVIGKAIGRNLSIEMDQQRVRPDTSEVDRLCGSSDKAAAIAGWSPAHSLEEGIAATIKWLAADRRFSRPLTYRV